MKTKKIITICLVLFGLFLAPIQSRASENLDTSVTSNSITVSGTISAPLLAILQATSPVVGLIVCYGTTATTISTCSNSFYADNQSGNVVTIQNDGVFTYTIPNLSPNTNYSIDVLRTDGGSVLSSILQTQTTDTPVSVDNGSQPAAQCTEGADGYCLLAPIGTFTVIKNVDIPNYLDLIYKIGIGLAGVLALIMLFFGGIQYMSTDALTGKESGRDKMRNAILGLLLALGSYAILNTINPKLLNFTFGIDSVSTSYTPGDTSGDLLTTSTGLFNPPGVTCPMPGVADPSLIRTIVTSYVGKVTYKLGAKGSAGPSNTVLYDCSGFVNRVLQCAGMSFSGLGTGGIFSGAEAVTSITDTTVNNINLKPGDLLGWTVGGEETSGHVVIYIGNGEVSESHGHSGVGTATDISNRHISNYLSRIKFIKRAP